ncbi:putative abc transporter [Phaeomoniella chlamydospora]|uniref:Putative abc transporter n=1 Tax=Phaeomoniella chlamydospora TaxID=158046 RepID=A0A0G2E5U1_PHACM|nr:putative abc transporter [Phaeomoniella chlamydospora]
MIRGGAIGLIYERALSIKEGASDDSAAVTLISNDVDFISFLSDFFHELWAQCLQLVLVTSQASKYVTANITAKQKAWSMATQQRISITKAILDSMKNIKMMGLGSQMERKVRSVRKHEIEMGDAFRWLIVAFNLTANVLAIFAPVITLVIYAIQAKLRGSQSLDTNTAFTSIAIISMVTGPANMILVLVPQFAACLAALDRIQKYLLSPSREDGRLETKDSPAGQNGQRHIVENGHAQDSPKVIAASPNAVDIDRATIRPASTAEPVLNDITTTAATGGLVFVSGTVGTGKTTLVKAILGDLPLDSGTITIRSKRIGYCSQMPWLMNGTVKQIICGPQEGVIDEQWYGRVVYACDLEEDLEQMPNGDGTVVGSRGITLSGGQRQRLALARAIFARMDLLILDDVLSALDAKTERHIIDHLIGRTGMLLIIGEDGRIAEQGTWDDLRSEAGYISKIVHDEGRTADRLGDDSAENTNGPKSALAPPPKDDDTMDLTRKTGDVALYGYYFGAVGTYNLLYLMTTMALYSFFLAFAQYWLKWWTEAEGKHPWYYTSVYFILSIAAFLSFYGTITFSQDMQMIDRRLPIALLQVGNNVFKLLAACVLLFSVQRYMTITLPFTAVIVYAIQKLYLHTSRQLRFMDLESRSLLEGASTIRAFGWEQSFIADNKKKVNISQVPFYLLMCIQRWLNLVLDLLISVLAVMVVGLAVGLKGTTSGGQVGIALNVILTANTFLLNVVESWTTLETSLGAIARLKNFQKEVLPEGTPDETHEPSSLWPSTGSIEFRDLSAGYSTSTLALKNITLSISPGQKVGICGRTGSGKSSLLLSILRLIEIESGSIYIDDVDISTILRDIVRSRIITVPQDPMLVMTDTIRENLDPTGTIPDKKIIDVLKKVKLWTVIQSRGTSAQAAAAESDAIDTAMGAAGISTSTPSPGSGTSTSPTTTTTTDPKPSSTSSSNPLSSPMKTYPLSRGQQQLFSIARAILMREYPTRGKIVLLDEATSNVDGETDQQIQKVIREEFLGYTIVTVAHRLETIMDADEILVLEKGGVVERGKPVELREREGGVFEGLWRSR